MRSLIQESNLINGLVRENNSLLINVTNLNFLNGDVGLLAAYCSDLIISNNFLSETCLVDVDHDIHGFVSVKTSVDQIFLICIVKPTLPSYCNHNTHRLSFDSE